jgi:hypothetical protein
MNEYLGLTFSGVIEMTGSDSMRILNAIDRCCCELWMTS